MALTCRVFRSQVLLKTEVQETAAAIALHGQNAGLVAHAFQKSMTVPTQPGTRRDLRQAFGGFRAERRP